MISIIYVIKLHVGGAICFVALVCEIEKNCFTQELDTVGIKKCWCDVMNEDEHNCDPIMKDQYSGIWCNALEN